MPAFSEGFSPVSPGQIAAVERRLRVVFPDDYKGFLATTNGGVPEPNCFTVPGCGDALVAFLYGIRAEQAHGDLEWEQEQAGLWDPLPAYMVVIGHDPGNNTLLLDTSGEEQGRIFFWDRVGFWHTDEGHNTFPVAVSFTSFVESLHPIPAAV